MQITFDKKDIELVRHLRDALQEKTVNVGSLEKLLTTLEGKISSPSGGEQKKRRVLKYSRTQHHTAKLIGKNIF